MVEFIAQRLGDDGADEEKCGVHGVTLNLARRALRPILAL